MAFWEKVMQKVLKEAMVYLINNTYFLCIQRVEKGFFYGLYDLQRILLQDGTLEYPGISVLDAGKMIIFLLGYSEEVLEIIPYSIWQEGGVEVEYEA